MFFYLGYYGEGGELIDYVLDTVHREIENTDCLQGKYKNVSFVFRKMYSYME